MEKYTVRLSDRARKSLKLIDKVNGEKLIKAMITLRENPRPMGYIKMKGEERYRIKVGDYRIVYEIFDNRLLVFVVRLGHRKDIYK